MCVAVPSRPQEPDRHTPRTRAECRSAEEVGRRSGRDQVRLARPATPVSDADPLPSGYGCGTAPSASGQNESIEMAGSGLAVAIASQCLSDGLGLRPRVVPQKPDDARQPAKRGSCLTELPVRDRLAPGAGFVPPPLAAAGPGQGGASGDGRQGSVAPWDRLAVEVSVAIGHGNEATQGCPCGFLGDPVCECRCTPQQITRYRDKLSGPLRDRLDLTVEVPALPPDTLGATAAGESSAAVRARVVAARERQLPAPTASPAPLGAVVLFQNSSGFV